MLTNVMCRLAVLADKQNAPRPQLRFLGRGILFNSHTSPEVAAVGSFGPPAGLERALFLAQLSCRACRVRRRTGHFSMKHEMLYIYMYVRETFLYNVLLWVCWGKV